MYFVAYLHQEGLAPGTVKSYLSAVRHSQICLGFGDPGIGVMPRLEYVIKGSKRLAGSVSSRTRLPITPHILRQCVDGLSRQPQCVDAVGSFVYVLLRVLASRRGGGP